MPTRPRYHETLRRAARAFAFALAGVLLTAGATAPAYGQTSTLAELAAGQNLVAGDLVFSAWRFGSLSTVDPDVVTISAIDDPDTPGFTVNGNGELEGDGARLEYAFEVSTVGGVRIIKAQLALRDYVSLGGEITASLEEDDPQSQDPLLLEVSVGGSVDDLTDTAAVPFRSEIAFRASARLAQTSLGGLRLNSYDTQFLVPGPFDLSGQISVSEGTAVDSDVNDPNAPFASNDTTETSQPIPAPAILGGYLNQPGAGEPGRSQAGGDLVDSFRASLPAGFTATLFIAGGDGVVNDLDLFLYDVADPSTPIDSSMGTDGVESVTALVLGDYYIVVAIDEGATEAATNYLLTVGSSPAPPSSGMSLGDEFAIGQAIVRFDDDPGAGAAEAGATRAESATNALQARAARIGLEPVAGAAGRPMLFEMGPTARAAQARGAASPLDAWLPRDPETREKLETLRMVKRLRRRPDVLAADPNYVRRVTVVPNDPLYLRQWHYPQIFLPQAWDVTTGSSDTVVAVIDTGVLRDHPDLRGSLLSGPGSGYDFIRSPSRAADGDGIDPDWNDSGDFDGTTPQSSFHGTHVSGTIAAATNNGRGVAGVNWNARIMPLRVLGIGGGLSYDIQQGVRYAAGLPNDSGTLPQQKADVMNLSLGGFGSSQSEQDTYLEARAEGVIIVASAGNNGNALPSYPASYDGVVSVSATNVLNELANYSSFGPTVDVAAPGGTCCGDLNNDTYVDMVLSTLGDDRGSGVRFVYRHYQGTSMAAPHVSGVASLMKALNPDLTPENFDALLVLGLLTDDLGAPGRDDEFGYGLINAQKAVVAAGGPPPNQGILVVTPSSLNYGLATNALNLTVRNAGGGPLSITGTSDDADWLMVSAADVDASGLGTYAAVVDRTALSAGAYQATITVESTEGSQDVPVVMAVGGNLTGDAGFHYVRLRDFDTLEIVSELGLPVTAGTYDFSFTGVPPGVYLLSAGSDTDNDAQLCETGEACGAYPVLNEPTPITLDQDLADLDFTSRYPIPLDAGPAPCDAAGGDSDEDGVCDGGETPDNCPFTSNEDQADTNGNGRGDACECGDFDGNGSVNTSDARLIQRCAVGNFECVALADVTCDGDVNSSDARIIQRFSVGEFDETALSCEELAPCP